MIDRDTLDRLADSMTQRGGALPAVKCQPFYDMMSELFTAEEAVLATKLPLEAMTAGQLSQITGLGDDVRLKNTLESMADRGLILAEKGGDNTTYQLLPLLPGMMEFQFLKGGTSERDRRVILLIHEYLKSVNRAYAATRQATETDAASGKKRITLDALVAHIAVVHSYSQVLELIEKTEHMAVGTCLCRHRGEMLDRPCDKPKDVCMIFGPEAKAAADRGMVRMLSKAEARAVLDRAEEAGLVHQSMYHCCSCHCGTLRGIKRSPAPSLAAMVRQVINIDKTSCIVCGDCVTRCQMEALTMDGTDLHLDEKRCISCGLCMYACPVDALELVARAHPWDTIPVSQQ
jgi:ferredoxin